MEIEDRFYQELEFGTAGLRGVIGAGTNRMNKYTVGKATQGLANYILEQGTKEKVLQLVMTLEECQKNLVCKQRLFYVQMELKHIYLKI